MQISAIRLTGIVTAGICLIALSQRPLPAAPPATATASTLASKDNTMEKLNQKLVKVEFNEIVAADVVQFMRDVSDLSIVTGGDGFDGSLPFTYAKKDVPARQVLAELAKSFKKPGIEMVVVDNVVFLWRPDDLKGYIQARARSHGTDSKEDTGVRERMGNSLSKTQFYGVELYEVLRFISDASGQGFSVDWNALGKLGLEKKTPVNIRTGSITYDQALLLSLLVASGKGIDYDIIDGKVVIPAKIAASAPASKPKS